MALASTSRQWGAYFNEVDEKIHDLVSICRSKGGTLLIISRKKTRAHNSDLPSKGKDSKSGAVWIEFPDMQQLELLHDELHSIESMLTNNLDVSHKVAGLFQHDAEARGSLEICISRTVQHRRRVETMIARLDSVAKLVRIPDDQMRLMSNHHFRCKPSSQFVALQLSSAAVHPPLRS